MVHDIKHALRMLLRTKGWTVVVLLSLAIGIGATTALFTAVNGLMLQTIPVKAPHELAILKWTGTNDMVRARRDCSAGPRAATRARDTEHHHGRGAQDTHQ